MAKSKNPQPVLEALRCAVVWEGLNYKKSGIRKVK